MRIIGAVILCSIFASGCVHTHVTVNGYTGGHLLLSTQLLDDLLVYTC